MSEENVTTAAPERTPAGLEAAVAHTAEPPPVYSTMGIGEILRSERKPAEEIWGGFTLEPGNIMEIIGGSGLGKSRMMLNLAINQVLGKKFADLKTLNRPLTWLFYGNENSFDRFRNDVRKMTADMKPEELALLNEHIFLPTMDKPSDAYVDLSDEANRAKLAATIALRKPDVVVFDPWGSIMDGDELSDADVVKTVKMLTGILTSEPEKVTTAIVLNHSRNGMAEMVNAAGINKANYGKNSKKLYSIVRCVWNLRPGHFPAEGEPTTKIELIHAKSSNRIPYPPRAVDFNQENFHYDFDEHFNHSVWQLALEKDFHSHKCGTLSDANRALLKQKSDEDLKSILFDHIKAVKSEPRKLLGEWAKQNGMGENFVQRILTSLQQDGKITILRDKFNQRTVATPEEAQSIISRSAPDTYRVVQSSGSSTPRGPVENLYSTPPVVQHANGVDAQ